MFFTPIDMENSTVNITSTVSPAERDRLVVHDARATFAGLAIVISNECAARLRAGYFGDVFVGEARDDREDLG